MKKHLIVLCLFFSASASAIEMKTSQGDFSAQITLSAKQINLNDLLTVEIALAYPITYSPQVAILRKELLSFEGFYDPAFNLSSESITPALQQPNGRESQIIIFTLAPQLAGKHYLSFPRIVFKPKQKGQYPTVNMISNVFEVSVTSTPINFKPQELIEPLLPLSKELPVSMTTANRQKYIHNPLVIASEAVHGVTAVKMKAFPWEIIIAAAAVYLVYLLITKLPLIALKPNADLSKEKAPHTIALEEVQTLMDSKLLENGRYQDFFYSLDRVVRSYIEKNYHLDAQTCTTAEFLEKSAASPIINQETKSELAAFFEHSDRVKFALYHPSKEECAAAIHSVKQFLT